MLGAQLAEHPEIQTVLVDAKPGPIEVGQADGVSGRSLEIFHSMGFAHRVLEEAYQLRALSFWRYDDSDPEVIIRRYKQDDGRIAFSRFPHVVLNQARVHDFLLECMEKAPASLHPHYDLAVTGIENNDSSDYPLAITLTGPSQGQAQHRRINARYLVGCDGAHSLVRKSQGLAMEGESSNKAWGVMDLLLVTDFPDIRTKSIIESADHGTLMIIPREGGHLVRFYVELEKTGLGLGVDRSAVTLEQLIDNAAAILQPYQLDVKEVPWWSVYEVGQRLCAVFDDRGSLPDRAMHPRVFIAGDACHTHSPKAGQGMNVSMHDAHNLGWKLAAVAMGHCDPSLLLTYSDERQAIARELIDFDQRLAALFSAPATASQQDQPTALQQALLEADAYVSGTRSHYLPSSIVLGECPLAEAWQMLPGKRLDYFPVIRAADACPMALNDCLLADGRWRVLLMPGLGQGDTSAAEDWLSELNRVADWWHKDPGSPVVRCTPQEQDIDSVIEILAVLPCNYREVEWATLTDALWPARGQLGLRDYGKVFTHDQPGSTGGPDQRHPESVCVIVRPDQHVAGVFPLNKVEASADFFATFMTTTEAPALKRNV